MLTKYLDFHIIEIGNTIHLKCTNIIITISSQFMKVQKSSQIRVSIKELLNYEKEDNNDSTKITPRKILQQKKSLKMRPLPSARDHIRRFIVALVSR